MTVDKTVFFLQCIPIFYIGIAFSALFMYFFAPAARFATPGTGNMFLNPLDIVKYVFEGYERSYITFWGILGNFAFVTFIYDVIYER